MRKRREPQTIGKQLSLFERRGITYIPSSAPGASQAGDIREVDLRSELAQMKTLTRGLLGEVMSLSNLNRAYGAVMRNGGAAGVDGMETKDLGAFMSSEGSTLRESVLTGTYEPQAVRGVRIPKPNGGERQLGIPTVRDRLIQQALHQQMRPFYEGIFSESSYGFRPGRSALDAVAQASKYVSEGYTWVVDIDLKRFFDQINHDRLMQRLSQGMGDKELLRLIHRYLRSGLMQDGLESQRTSGTPQGGPLSPLLSNIYLDELDQELEKRGHRFCRYADDCNIFVGSRKAGERVMASVIAFIERKLKLQVNHEKSGVRPCSSVKFLGYTILSDGRIRIADQSLKRFKQKVREITKRNRGVKFSQVIEELNQVIQGWTIYFRLANAWLPWQQLDGWIRRRLRCYRLKQCGRKYTVYKLLRSLGAGERPAWNAVMYGGRWWALSRKPVCATAMGINWFAQQGLQSLAYVHQRVQTSQKPP
jgi:RNA-directed DNA polymerase